MNFSLKWLAVSVAGWFAFFYAAAWCNLYLYTGVSNSRLESRQLEVSLIEAKRAGAVKFAIGDRTFVERVRETAGESWAPIVVPRPNFEEIYDAVTEVRTHFPVEGIYIQASPQFWSNLDDGVEEAGPRNRLDLWDLEKEKVGSAKKVASVFFTTVRDLINQPEEDAERAGERPSSLHFLRYRDTGGDYDRFVKRDWKDLQVDGKTCAFVVDTEGLPLASNESLVRAFQELTRREDGFGGVPFLTFESIQNTKR